MRPWKAYNHWCKKIQDFLLHFLVATVEKESFLNAWKCQSIKLLNILIVKFEKFQTDDVFWRHYDAILLSKSNIV